MAELFRFDNLSRFPELIHAISDRRFGSVHPREAGGWQRLAELVGISPGAIVSTQQVHGDRIVRVSGPDYDCRAGGPGGPLDAPQGDPVGVDGLITATPGLLLLGYFADCVPVLIYDPVRRAVGLAHAGWRGTLLGIAGLLVEEMSQVWGSYPGDLLAGLGPSIGPCCYEVGQEMIEGVRTRLPEPEGLLQPGRPGHANLDLWEANRRALVRAGLSPERVEVAGLCTSCHVGRFFSYRREGQLNGLFGAVIGIRV